MWSIDVWEDLGEFILFLGFLWAVILLAGCLVAFVVQQLQLVFGVVTILHLYMPSLFGLMLIGIFAPPAAISRTRWLAWYHKVLATIIGGVVWWRSLYDLSDYMKTGIVDEYLMVSFDNPVLYWMIGIMMILIGAGLVISGVTLLINRWDDGRSILSVDK